MMIKTNSMISNLGWKALLPVASFLMIGCSVFGFVQDISSNECTETEDSEDSEDSIWESKPIETDSVKVQILDKISGKVFKKNIKLNSPETFGSIELKLKRCFKNGPEDDKEITAFVEISERGKVIFANWIFASSPTINLFSHPVYDIRIEF